MQQINLVQTMVLKRVDVLLKDLEDITEEIIEEGQRKSKSTAVADLMTQGELPPETIKRLGAINLQLTLLSKLTGVSE